MNHMACLRVALAHVGQHEQKIVRALFRVLIFFFRWRLFIASRFGLKPMKAENLFQVQALGPELPHVPLDADGVRKLFYSISGRDDIVIHDVTWVSEWRWDCDTLAQVYMLTQNASQGQHPDVREVWEWKSLSRWWSVELWYYAKEAANPR